MSDHPTPRERSLALVILGMLLVVTTPLFAPASAAALVVGAVLAREGFSWQAAIVVVAALAGLAVFVLAGPA